MVAVLGAAVLGIGVCEGSLVFVAVAKLVDDGSLVLVTVAKPKLVGASALGGAVVLVGVDAPPHPASSRTSTHTVMNSARVVSLIAEERTQRPFTSPFTVAPARSKNPDRCSYYRHSCSLDPAEFQLIQNGANWRSRL